MTRYVLGGFALLAAAAPATAQLRWTVDTATSSVAFRVQHMLIHHVTGRFTTFSGSVTASDAAFADAAIEAVVDVTSIDTGRQARDANLRDEAFFDAASHPTMTFRSTSVTRTGGSRFRVEGDLTIRGITRPVALEAHHMTSVDTGPASTDRIVATTTVNRFDFGLRYDGRDLLAALSRAVPVVGDSVEITLDVTLQRDTTNVATTGAHR